MPKSLKFALVAGEHSGDQLAAPLIRELRQRYPTAQFYGVGGPKMAAEGFDAWFPSERLAVMGLVEVITHLPSLFSLRRTLKARLIADPPDVFIGVDAPSFNLGLAGQLRDKGIRTVQYVSPQIWAWRQDRVHGIARAVDLILCLLPFEEKFYASVGVRTAFVGHPLADQIPMEPDRAAARQALGLGEGPVVAVLPGSRMGEVKRLGAPFAGAIGWLHAQRPGVQFIAPMASAKGRAVFESALREAAPEVRVHLLAGQAQTALAAADAVLVASGTATLETALSKRPMVVAYRLHPLTAWLVRRFNVMKTQHFSQPNLLAGRALVPEFLQEQATPAALGAALLDQLENEGRRQELAVAFETIHHQLRREASQRAAEAVAQLLEDRRGR